MESRAEEYRKKAEVADADALRVKDSEAKRAYIEIARIWREMAAQAERNGS